MVTQDMVNSGYGVTITSVTLTVIFLTWFLYLEWSVRHPIQIESVYPSVGIQEIETEDIPQPQTNTRPMIALPSLPLPKFWKKADPDPDPAPAITEDMIEKLRLLIREEVTASQKKIETTPIEAAQMPTTGSPGRLSRQQEYARKWARWEATGFDHGQCPWKNPYAFKKRVPTEELLVEARKALVK